MWLKGKDQEAVSTLWMSVIMATGRDQLRYHGKHRYLTTAELYAGHNYYKILFSHVNYLLAACKCRAHIKKNSTISCLFAL
jgi:hypothetical protein